jgi:hypothetical protein
LQQIWTGKEPTFANKDEIECWIYDKSRWGLSNFVDLMAFINQGCSS